MVSSWRVWLWPVLFSVVYFLVQLTQLSQYGVTWDEPLHRNWGKIFAVFWQSGDRRLLDLMPGNGIQYGPLYFYLNFIVSEFFFTRGWLTFVEANHILTLLVSAFAVGGTYVLGQMMGGKRIAIFSGLFVVLFPQFIAHAHYNPKDIPLMAAVVMTALVFLAALRRDSRPLLVLSAFLFGFSVAMKINALLMAPVFGITYLAWMIKTSRDSSVPTVIRRELLVVLGASIACVGGLYLSWPSAWGDWLLIPRSIQFFLGESFWPGQVLFFGTEYGGAVLPFYYIPFEFAVAMPLLMLIACIAGVVVSVRALAHVATRTESLFVLLWIIVPLAFSMKPELVRYDGMRQFFFVLPAVAVISAVGFQKLLELLQRRSKNRFAGVIFLGLVFLSLSSQVLTLHPFEGSYRNELLQLAYHQNLDESFQIEYWGASYKQGMDWLMQNAEPNPVICVPTAGILVTWYPWRDDFTFECSQKSDYVMFFTRYTDARAYRELKDPIFSIERMKSKLLLIYKIK